MEYLLKAYTDGSFSKNKPEVYGWGVAIHDDKDYLIDSISGTGNKFIESWQIGGECEAVLRIMTYVLNSSQYKNISILEINYDYIGVEKWALGQWKAKKDVSQEYVKDFLDLKRQLMARNIMVHFVKVKGHSGNKGNDKADELASGAVNLYYEEN